MTFLWPQMLWLLALVPVLVGVYLLALRRRARRSTQLAALFPVRDSRGRRPGLRGHLPALAFLLAVALGMVAIARPTATVTLPFARGTVMLSMDVSGSMRAQDIKPSRMEAVKDAARSFIGRQPGNVRIGIVAFSGTAILVQPPTNDKKLLLTAIDALEPQLYTAIGSGLLVALEAIFPKPQRESTDSPADALTPAQQDPVSPPVAPGSFKSAAIVLLSDGQSNQGMDPVEAANRAANLGVRVYTVGVGTKAGAIIGFGSYTFHAILDEATLRQVASITGGSYFKASSAGDLRRIYGFLSTRLMVEQERTEITSILAAFAIVFFVGAGVASVLWFRRVL
jgi:Ca-activated chloride channel homolog